MHEFDITHRDLHQKNVMLHFKQASPTPEDLESPVDYFKKQLPGRLKEAIQHLDDPSTFEIKIIDFGYSRELRDKKGDDNQIRTLTKGIGCGMVAAPELDENSKQDYDKRVDVWYIGVLLLVLLSNNPTVISKKE